MKKFLRNINVLNLMLIAAIVFSLNYQVSSGPDAGTSRSAIRFTKLHPGVFSKSVSEDNRKMAAADPPDSYSIIARQNLFNPERIIPVETTIIKPIPLPSRPKLVLLGTMVTGDSSVAYIKREDAQGVHGNYIRPVYSQPVYGGTRGQMNLPVVGGGKPKAYKKGDSISGFILTGIETDKVYLVRGKETMVVYLAQPVKDLPGSIAQFGRRGFTSTLPAH